MPRLALSRPGHRSIRALESRHPPTKPSWPIQDFLETTSITGVATVMTSRKVIIIISGQSKALALAKCVEEGVNHMYTVSMLQMHPHLILVVDEDATLELKVKTVKYFKSIESVQDQLERGEDLCKLGSAEALKRSCAD